MSNNKQSSVEWYANEEDKLFTSYQKGLMSTAKYILFKYKLREQAKAMHKEEMVDFGNDLLAQNDINYIGMPNLAEKYFNETFGGEK